MTTMEEIEKRAKVLALTRAALEGIVADLQAAIEALQRDAMKPLKQKVRDVAEQHDKLRALIEAHPELFQKPKTVVLHGIKLGYRKGVGGLEFEDADQVVKLIRKHFPEQFDVLVKTRETPAKEALQQLTVAELKKLGVTVEDTGDVVFIKPTDGAVDKLVKALLKSAVDEKEGV